MPEKPPTHIRLPQRAEAVVGAEQQPGTPAPVVKLDPRTVTQDPALKAKLKSAERTKQQSVK